MRMRFAATPASLLVLVALVVVLAGCGEKPEPKIAGAADRCSGPALVAFGHSYVQGNAPGAPAKPWPARVAKELGVCDDNRGVSGSQSSNTAGFVAGYTPAKQDVIVIETILNDVFVTGVRGIPAFRKQIAGMFEHLTTAGEDPKKIAVVIDPPPAAWTGRPNQVPPFVHGSDGTLDQYAKALEDVAVGEYGATIVDLRTGWSTDRDLLPDELHPNEAGTARIARAVTRAVS